MSALRILIVDDHLLIRCGLKQILEREFPSVTVGEAQNGSEAIQQVAEKSWDVVVMDINMPGRSGLVVLQDLKHLHPKLPVLILSAYSEDEFALRVLKAGAAGFVAKESTHLELVKAIRKVLSGGKYITDSVAEKLANQFDIKATGAPHEALSDREYQVVCLIGSGKTPTEIAHELSLSVKTVSTYRARILEKLNMKTNAQLIHYMISNGLVN
ncbi:MAG: Response regulator, LuxR family [Verrucomicrobiales bacterium]|nr:Response regulator, LuxR family [Verrucomicrobiales bacterium]